jgi:hypothetical protein
MMEPDIISPIDTANADAIRAQLKRLLEHHVFKGSRRCSHLLEFLVEYRLRGETAPPKERTLGIEVFDRESDYDTSEDPVVRGAANETRKRIAQYYLEPGHENEVRFDLPTGSYVLEFHMPEQETKPQSVESVPSTRHGVSPYFGVFAAAILICCVLGIVWMSQPRALDRFWSPLLDSSDRLLICVLSTASAQTDAGMSAEAGTQPNVSPSPFDSRMKIPFVTVTDNSAMVSIIRFLGAKKTKFEVEYQTLNGNLTDDLIQPSLAELRKGPVVFVGGSDWTYRILPSLRFHTNQDNASGVSWIEDAQNPSNKKWILKMNQPFGESTQDYAIISRVFDNMTGQILLFVTGIGLHGTAAAGEFITSPSFMNQVASSSSSEWKKKNLQIVISTQIAGKAWGSPQLVVKHFW